MSGVRVLTFEGLKDLEPVNNYYNNGLGGSGSGPGPNYGITFGQDSVAAISYTLGGHAYVSGNPSGTTVVGFVSGPGVVMNVAQGFSNGFSFYYSGFYVGIITVYDGANATGNILKTITLPANSLNCPSTTVNGYSFLIACVWQQSNNSFAGTAKSVDFQFRRCKWDRFRQYHGRLRRRHGTAGYYQSDCQRHVITIRYCRRSLQLRAAATGGTPRTLGPEPDCRPD